MVVMMCSGSVLSMVMRAASWVRSEGRYVPDFGRMLPGLSLATRSVMVPFIPRPNGWMTSAR